MHRHRARRIELSFYRERDRHEIDLLADQGGELTAIEIEAGSTPTADYFKAFRRKFAAGSDGLPLRGGVGQGR